MEQKAIKSSMGMIKETTQKIISLCLVSLTFLKSLISKIFKLFLKLPTLVVITVILIGIWFTYNKLNFLHNLLSKPIELKVSANLITFNKENTLFTSFAVIDVVDTKKGYLKREELFGLFSDEPPTATVGYCKKSYEVGIGYKNVHDLIVEFSKKKEFTVDDLPEPSIITINPISSETRGKYGQNDCDRLDMDTQKRLEIIREKLQPGWSQISNSSKEILYTFIKLISTE